MILYSALLAGFTTVIVLTTSIFSTLTPQDVYAPRGMRGMWAADMPTPIKDGGACPYASDYSICTCDDAELMQHSADKYFAQHRV